MMAQTITDIYRIHEASLRKGREFARAYAQNPEANHTLAILEEYKALRRMLPKNPYRHGSREAFAVTQGY